MKLPKLFSGFVALCTLPLALSAQVNNDHSVRLMKLETFVLPEYPGFLRSTGVNQGTVAMAIGHDAEGRPNDLLVLESTDPRFTDAAEDAVHEWKFAKTPPSERETPTPTIVRFLFSTRGVAVTPMLVASSLDRGIARADTPVSLPSFRQLDETPRVLQQPMPLLPATTKMRLSGGTVTVKFFVDEAGRARVPTIITATAPELGVATAAAISRWRFEPPKMRGRPVIAIETQTFQVGS